MSKPLPPAEQLLDQFESVPRANRLRFASMLVEQVLDTLDTDFEICGSCGLKHYNDLEARKVANRLSGTVTTLSNAISALQSRVQKEADAQEEAPNAHRC